MSADRQLEIAVLEMLAADSALAGIMIDVNVREGVVTLSGQVRRYAEKYAAMRAAERVLGVRAVHDRLELADPAFQAATDSYVANLIVDALRWHTEVPSDRIRVAVAYGWVRLTGDVEWEYQRRTAERIVRAVAGSFAVSNGIAIRQRKLPLAQ